MTSRQLLLLLILLPGLLLAQGGRYSVCFCGPAEGCCGEESTASATDAPVRDCPTDASSPCCEPEAPAGSPAEPQDERPNEGPLAQPEPCSGCHVFEVTELTSESSSSVQPGPSLVAWGGPAVRALAPPARPVAVPRSRPPPGVTRPLALRRGVMPMRI